jgi:ubiquinone/menaquinone biosynthesis C-methylase UbiE
VNCDPIARWYWLLETSIFGNQLKRTRERFLPAVSDAKYVLALGDGDGRALVSLLVMCPNAHVDYVDSSAKMLRIAQKRVEKYCNKNTVETHVCFRQMDILNAALPDAHYDVIVSHFFLDCFSAADAEKVIAHVTQSTAPHARWIISEFSEETMWAKAVVRTLYLFFRMTTGLRTNALVEYRQVLKKSGFGLVQREPRLKGLLVSELWQK